MRAISNLFGAKFLVKRSELISATDIAVLTSAGILFFACLINIFLKNLVLVYSGIFGSISLLIIFSSLYPNALLLRNDLVLGFIVCLIYPLVENTFAPLTEWGSYLTADVKIINTPLYVPFSFCFLTIFTSHLSSRVFHFTGNIIYTACIVGMIMFGITVIMEFTGLKGELWTFNKARFELLGVPVFIPFSYALCFSVLAYTQKILLVLRGFLFSLSIGLSWLVSYWIIEVAPGKI